MANVKPIRTEADYDAAVARIGELMDAGLDTPEGEELDLLADLVLFYESQHMEKEFPTPIAAIEFRMDQAGLSPRDLIPYIGSRAKVSEVLSGKRAITMAMARALHQHLGIPAGVLLQEPGVDIDDSLAGIEWTRFPLKSMAKLGWIPNVPDLKDQAEELVRSLIRRAGGQRVAVAPQFRKNDHCRLNAKTDAYALRAWCWRVMAQARNRAMNVAYERGTVTETFLRDVALLSTSDDGPRQARDFLAEQGIGFEFVPPLPKTYLDGAALRLADGRPVIGLTLRYDRIDNFWFTLLHELAHLGLHLDTDEDELFTDDLSLRNGEGDSADPKEAQADAWAQEALISQAVWETSGVREGPTPMAVIDVAYELKIHPAIIAGRIRYETGNYRLLSQFVGTGNVRRQFEVGVD